MANELPIVYRKTRPTYHGTVTVNGQKQRVETYMIVSGSLDYFVKTNTGDTIILQTEDPDRDSWQSKGSKREYVMVTEKTPKRGLFAGRHTLYNLGSKHFIDVSEKIVQLDIVFFKVRNIWKNFFIAENDYGVYYIIVK